MWDCPAPVDRNVSRPCWIQHQEMLDSTCVHRAKGQALSQIVRQCMHYGVCLPSPSNPHHRAAVRPSVCRDARPFGQAQPRHSRLSGPSARSGRSSGRRRAPLRAAPKSLVDHPHSIRHPILSSDDLPQLSGAFAYRLICDRDTYGISQPAGGQTSARDGGRTSAQRFDPPCPERLIIGNVGGPLLPLFA